MWWKRDPNRRECDDCGHELPIKKLYKFTWRYNSKTKTYKHSGRAFIITGYKYLCKKCLHRATK